MLPRLRRHRRRTLGYERTIRTVSPSLPTTRRTLPFSSGLCGRRTSVKGQVYLGVQKDSNGKWLQGGNNYALRITPNPPVEQFWAMTLYDTETRCFIENEHEIAGLDSRMDLVRNADGSVDLYFGPKPPEGLEKNWIPTVSGRGWFAYFRLYAPTEDYFDRSWRLPDLVRVK